MTEIYLRFGDRGRLICVAEQVPPGLDGYSYRLRRLREHLGIDSTEVLPMLTDPHGCVRTSA